jgi:hypothetical protein
LKKLNELGKEKHEEQKKNEDQETQIQHIRRDLKYLNENGFARSTAKHGLEQFVYREDQVLPQALRYETFTTIMIRWNVQGTATLLMDDGRTQIAIELGVLAWQ